MDKHMSTWTLNFAFVAIGAFAVFTPDPAELRKAFQTPEPAQRVAIQTTEEAAVVELVSTTGETEVSLVVDSPKMTNCLLDFQGDDIKAVSTCRNELVSYVASFDEQALKLRAQGIPISPNPRIEGMRMAVVNLCRVHWAANQGEISLEDLSGCTKVTQGVAY